MLTIGIVGYGLVSGEHINGWKNTGNVISAIADPEFRKISRRLPGARMFSSAEAMLSASQLNVIDICTPHHLHWPQVASTKDWKGTIMVEKPLVVTTKALNEMGSLLGGHAAPVILRTNKRFEPHVKPLLAALAEDQSMPLSVKVVWRQRPKYMASRPWYYNKAISGGGVVLGMGIHYLEIFAEYLPDLVLQQAYLRTSRRSPNSPETTAENYAHLKFSSSRGTVELVLSCWRSASVLPFEQITAKVGKRVTRWTRPAEFDRQRSLTDEFNSYVTMIRTRRSHPDPAVLYRAHALALSAYSSLALETFAPSERGGHK